MQGDINKPAPGRVPEPIKRRGIRRPVYRKPTNLIDDVRPASPEKKKRRRLHISKWFVIGIILFLIVTGGVVFYVTNLKSNNNLPLPIPKQTAATLGFDIYYPNQKLLPAGYVLNKNSFSYNDQALIYTVSYGNNQHVAFSVQRKLSSDQLAQFYAKNMPLRINLDTDIGTAALGSINLESVASLPTNTNSWLLISAPGGINQSEFKEVIKSLELSK